MQNVWEMAKSGKWLFNNLKEQKILEVESSLEDEYGKTALHIAAQHGKLADVPKFLLTPKNMVKQDKEGKTVLHYSTLNSRNGFKNIPEGLINETNMLIEDINNNTLYHMLGYSKDMHLLNKTMLKEEHLIKPNSLGITPIEYICRGESIVKKDSLDFFKQTLMRFKKETLTMLKEKGSIKGAFEVVLNKEIKKRVIAMRLSKGKKTIEIL